MKKTIILLVVMLSTLTTFSQKLRDSILIKTDIFEVMYSEKLEQPIWVKYKVLCPNGTAPRTGMDFYTNDSVKTSDSKDYENNIWDKGHMAPAADFNCTKEMLYKTFSYLNCSLQEQTLNRGAWRLLEVHERDLSKTNKEVSVEIKCEFSKKSIVLPSGATVPDGYTKIIKSGTNTEVFHFKNEKPLTTDYLKFKVN